MTDRCEFQVVCARTWLSALEALDDDADGFVAYQDFEKAPF